MRSVRFTFAALCVLACSSAVAAQHRDVVPREALIVSTTWLAQHLKDPDLVLLHVGDRAEYDRSHIPGARFVNLSDISVSDHSGEGLMLQMPAADSLRAQLATLGISNDSRVVVYYGKDWVSPSTRVLFTLDYAGLGARSSLLDGGMQAWTSDGHEVTAALPATKVGNLSALHTRPIVVDAEYVRDHVGRAGVSVVDGRTASFYDGVQTGGGHTRPHRTGHIAGAKSIPFSEVTDDRLFIKPSAELAAVFAKAGVQPADTVIAYCHIGQQATAVLFAARALGHPVLLYDGSFEDWSRHADYPVENPSAAKAKP